MRGSGSDRGVSRRGPQRPRSCSSGTCWKNHDLATDKLRPGNDILLAQETDRSGHGTEVDATLIAAPSPTKNAGGERDPEMNRPEGQPWDFGMKAHIGVDADSGPVHKVRGHGGERNDLNARPATSAWR